MWELSHGSHKSRLDDAKLAGGKYVLKCLRRWHIVLYIFLLYIDQTGFRAEISHDLLLGHY